jgi:hypothetical protein
LFEQRTYTVPYANSYKYIKETMFILQQNDLFNEFQSYCLASTSPCEAISRLFVNIKFNVLWLSFFSARQTNFAYGQQRLQELFPSPTYPQQTQHDNRLQQLAAFKHTQNLICQHHTLSCLCKHTLLDDTNHLWP